jgi:AmiR/NasT family two-component response regulator
MSLVNDDTTNPSPARRVLVAEDEALIRLDLVELLTEEGMIVVGQAANGEEAVEMAREFRPDVVVMDVKMPKLDGISAAEIIAKERIAPVVILTAFSQRELVERASEAGAMAYVVKPFDASDVVPAIEIAAAGSPRSLPSRLRCPTWQERLASRKAVDQAKGLAAGVAGAHRGRGVPLDPEDRDGPAQVDARGRRGRRRPPQVRPGVPRRRPEPS